MLLSETWLLISNLIKSKERFICRQTVELERYWPLLLLRNHLKHEYVLHLKGWSLGIPVQIKQEIHIYDRINGVLLIIGKCLNWF
jgi:hypothetical protein